MLELILGTRNGGKSPLALRRAIGDYKYYKKSVAYFSDNRTLEEYHEICEFNDLDFIATANVAYHPFSMFLAQGAKSWSIILDTLLDMSAENCRPQTVVIDCSFVTDGFKSVHKLEKVFPDILFVVTMNSDTFYNVMRNTNNLWNGCCPNERSDFHKCREDES